jgi:hypothetical protein
MAEMLYIAVNVIVLPGWLLLIFAPRWKWTTSLVTTVALPIVLGVAYFALLAANLPAVLRGGTFMQLADVAKLFANEYCLLAGWIHYLAFDLFVGSWEVRDARRVGLPQWMIVPCLLLTFVLGPIGLLSYILLRWTVAKRVTIDD